MRTEQEMYDLILGTAREDERIRGVYMNGSRTNVNADKDIFQDFDIVYVVTDTAPFYEDETWIDRFGKRLYMQMPEWMDRRRGIECDFQEAFGWLIQFEDGNRLDLHVVSIPFGKRDVLQDKLCCILLNKDGILPDIPKATDEDRYVKKPAPEEFLCNCNDFWWCMNNVAKGLWRNEIPYVQDILNLHLRPYLQGVLASKIGFTTDFSCSIGKSGKYMYRYLDRETWERFLATYADGRAEHIWESVMNMCSLFDETAQYVAEKLGCTYNHQEAAASRGYLEHVRRLPQDAREIY